MESKRSKSDTTRIVEAIEKLAAEVKRGNDNSIYANGMTPKAFEEYKQSVEYRAEQS